MSRTSLGMSWPKMKCQIIRNNSDWTEALLKQIFKDSSEFWPWDLTHQPFPRHIHSSYLTLLYTRNFLQFLSVFIVFIFGKSGVYFPGKDRRALIGVNIKIVFRFEIYIKIFVLESKPSKFREHIICVLYSYEDWR